MKFINLKNFNKAVREAVNVLKEGGLIVYPTDTVYGLGCDATSASAVNRLFKLKKRSTKKPVSVIVKDIFEMKKYVKVNSDKEKIIKNLLPGPFTVVFKIKKDFLNSVSGGSGNLGVRIPKSKFTQKVAQEFGRPYTTTSVNDSGEISLYKIEEILNYFENKKEKPDLIIDAGDVEKKEGKVEASTVIDLTKLKPAILRKGAGYKKLKKIIKI
jgi:L-threonylcarbamoyladenylate synthase